MYRVVRAVRPVCILIVYDAKRTVRTINQVSLLEIGHYRNSRVMGKPVGAVLLN